mmetsp:Transcript_45107/g.130241  ORF Transcript_45107/g.130241 Transcript_45107/m.130241 type:complete len:239 (+) Transcript_45107:1264-1980(+)
MRCGDLRQQCHVHRRSPRRRADQRDRHRYDGADRGEEHEHRRRRGPQRAERFPHVVHDLGLLGHPEPRRGLPRGAPLGASRCASEEDRLCALAHRRLHCEHDGEEHRAAVGLAAVSGHHVRLLDHERDLLPHPREEHEAEGAHELDGLVRHVAGLVMAAAIRRPQLYQLLGLGIVDLHQLGREVDLSAVSSHLVAHRDEHYSIGHVRVDALQPGALGRLVRERRLLRPGLRILGANCG